MNTLRSAVIEASVITHVFIAMYACGQFLRLNYRLLQQPVLHLAEVCSLWTLILGFIYSVQGLFGKRPWPAAAASPATLPPTPVRSAAEWEAYMVRHDRQIASAWGSHIVKFTAKDNKELQEELAYEKKARATSEQKYEKLAKMYDTMQRKHDEAVKTLKKDPHYQLLS